MVEHNDCAYVREPYMKVVRQLNSVLSFVLLLQISYLAQLYSHLAPLVNTIFTILEGIVYFTAMLILCVIAFAFSFFLIGQNQNDFDSIRPNDPLQLPIDLDTNCLKYISDDPVISKKYFYCKPMYTSFMGALETTWLIALGEF
jgi:Na+-transporting NADH:ubiquinone oxidoreductase subunit NqrB